jgi:pimeloyl-ACP methyl ester carboxylesterase
MAPFSGSLDRGKVVAMQQLDRDGVHIAYEVTNPGAGPVVLVSHGFSATSAMWAPNLGALARGRTVVAWDQRGHGDSDAPDDPAAYGRDVCVADMGALLDQVGAEKAVLVGMSLGGYLSLAFHLAHPRRVAALVLVDTGPGFRKDDAREQWNTWARQRGEEIERQGALGERLSTEVRQARHRDLRGVAMAARYVLTQADGQIMASLPGVAVPTLVVVGSEDTNFLAAADYMARTIPDARKVVIDKAGHASNLDQPDDFNAAVGAFLDGLPDQ